MSTCLSQKNFLRDLSQAPSLENYIGGDKPAVKIENEIPLIPKVAREQVEALSKHHESGSGQVGQEDIQRLGQFFLSLNDIADQVVHNVDFSKWLTPTSNALTASQGTDLTTQLEAFFKKPKQEPTRIEFIHADRNYILTVPVQVDSLEISSGGSNWSNSTVPEVFQINEAGNENEYLQFSFANLKDGRAIMKDISYTNLEGLDDQGTNTMTAHFLDLATKASEIISTPSFDPQVCFDRSGGIQLHNYRLTRD